MKASKIKAIVFDLDDTLYLEKEYVISGMKHISVVIKNRYHIDQMDVYIKLIDLFNESPSMIFNRFFESSNLFYRKEDILFLVKKYREHSPNISFCPDALEIIEYLREKNYLIGIITDGNRDVQRNKLLALNAFEKFDQIIVTDELGENFWKPNPKAYEIIMNKFQVNVDEIIYIGDNPSKDFYIKKYYPIKTFRINRGGVHCLENYLEDIKEDVLIKDLNEILRYL